MKRNLCIPFVIAFTIVLLSYSFAVAGNKNFWKNLGKVLAEDETKSQNIQKETLVNESFFVSPGTHKDYAWDFNRAGSLDINLTANTDVFLYIVDNENYAAYAAGREFRGFAIKEKITSTNFSVSIPNGSHHIVIYNAHIFKSAGIGLSVLYTPMQ